MRSTSKDIGRLKIIEEEEKDSFSEIVRHHHDNRHQSSRRVGQILDASYLNLNQIPDKRSSRKTNHSYEKNPNIIARR